MYKMSLGARVWKIADDYNIEQVQVHKIISSYIAYCRELLLSGNEVTFFGLVTLIPNIMVSDYKTTLAYQCKEVSKVLNMGYYTVYRIVSAYLEFLHDDLLSGNPIDIRGIVSLHPICNEGKVVKVHSSISISIKRDIEIQNRDILSVRAHTHKLLKHIIKQSFMNCQEVLTV